jgi:hypothetical protein
VTDEPSTAYEAFASISGLFIVDGLIADSLLLEFEPGLQVRELDDETQRWMYQTETVRRSGGRLFTDRVIAARYLFHKSLDSDRATKEVRRVNQLLQSVLECFRIYKPGRLYFGGIIHRRLTRDGAIDVFPRPWPENPLVLYPIESRTDIEGLAQLWTAMRSRNVRDRQHIDLARRWYSNSVETGRLEDRVISLMTAAEALFRIGPEERSKAQQIAQRVAALGIQPVENEVKFPRFSGHLQRLDRDSRQEVWNEEARAEGI